VAGEAPLEFWHRHPGSAPRKSILYLAGPPGTDQPVTQITPLEQGPPIMILFYLSQTRPLLIEVMNPVLVLPF